MTLEANRLRRAFDRSAIQAGEPMALAREVAARLLDRLELLRLAPRDILDLGAGSGVGMEGLRARFPASRILMLDFSLGQLRNAPGRPRSWWRFGAPVKRHAVCATAEQLPFAARSMGLVWSNLMLPLCPLDPVLKEIHRTLAPEGLFLFSTLGPDTLQELKSVFARQPDGFDHLPDFADMHDVGDALVQHGFADPVMERENLTVTYPTLEVLMRDLRQLGGANGMEGRRRSLAGRGRWQSLATEYDRLRQAGLLPATFEIVYGHAWKPAPRTMPDGRPVIQVRPA